jgi:Leucine-rich repeat (LRR) protein
MNMKKSYIILSLLFSFSIGQHCGALPYAESEYYYFTSIDINHVSSTLDCYYSNDWDILNEVITLNTLFEVEVSELGYQNWDSSGRLKNFTLNYSSSSSPQYIDQKVNTLPENFGELEMLQSLEMYYHDLTVFPLSFPQLENLKALNMKGNKLKILNPDFGSLTSLEVIDLGYNDLVALPESISGLINLNYFWIFGNDISYIPNSLCELDLDWSGASGDFIYFGSGGNHLCEDVPACVENSSFFNIMLEEQGYAFPIESEQVCVCGDGIYPDCVGICSDEENYGSIIDACGVCTSFEDACISDCTGDWGGSATLDTCGICDGDGSACEEMGTLSLIDNSDETWLINYSSPFSISSIHFEIEGAIATVATGFGSIMFFATSVNEIIEGSFFPTVPSGEGTLLTVSFDSFPISLNNITVTDANNASHPFVFDDGNIEICNIGFDCTGECGGFATLDACGICDGSGESIWYSDSDGDGLGNSQSSSSFCYEHEGYVSNSDDSDDSVFCPYQYLDEDYDCVGNCIVELDCAGVCGGNALIDECGECDGDNSTCLDCNGVVNGNALIDCSGICDNDPSNDYIIDCYGECGGSGLLDNCGVCQYDISDDCVQDNCGVWGGDGEQLHCRDLDGDGWGTSEFTFTTCDIDGDIWVTNCDDIDDTIFCESNVVDCAGVLCGDGIGDECGVCAGDNSTCLDCAGIPNGNSLEDNCATCDSDSTNDCLQDCSGEWGGDTIIDECGVCAGNGMEYYYADWDGDGFGDCSGDVYTVCPNEAESWMSNVCPVYGCTGYDSCNYNPEANIDDGSCIYPEANYDCYGECTAGVDCNGDCGGSAVIDECGVCIGGNTGLTGCEAKTLSMRPFIENPEEYTYTRGRYLIILGHDVFTALLSDENLYGDFVTLKKSQGYDVDVELYSSISPSNSITELKDWLEDYSDTYPLLEYVLLVGDVSGFAEIGTHRIPSYNEMEQDATDYPYTFFSEDEMYNPRFFIGRWSVSDVSEFLSIKKRTIDYESINGTENLEYLNRALLVAGSYKTESGAVAVPSEYWPVMPYWTSLWIEHELQQNSGIEIDTAYFHANNQITTTIDVVNPWNEGVGLVNYRGWGNATGWTKPEFKLDDFNDIINDEDLPVVFSLVSNTGDFGNETNDRCFGEKLTTYGSASSPKGAVAVIGPSDLSSDTQFGNILTGQMWDEMIEGRIYELAPILHAGKQAVAKEFEGLEVPSINGGTMSIPKFYHHIYNVLGDPSLSVWVGEPNEIEYELDSPILNESFVFVEINDENGNSLQDVVGALLDMEGNLIAKGISNEYGELLIDFENLTNNIDLELYLNAPQYFQSKIELIFESDNGNEASEIPYNYNVIEENYVQYSVISSVDDLDDAPVYNWLEINQIGTNINLTDDSQIHEVEIGFDFTYFDETYNSLSVCSNGWVSFVSTPINYFWNYSIPFPMGPDAMIAPFMDDLDDNGGTEPLNVYTYQDVSNHQFIVQWDNIANGEDDEYCGTEQDCTRETFQLILKDGESANGDILFQYKEIHDIDENGNYSTIGIESPDQNFGYQYQFRNIAYGSQLVENEMAILFKASSSSSEIIAGDTNFDGIVDILDIVRIVNQIMGNLEFNDDEFTAADFNADGIVDILDIVQIVNYILP